MHKQFWSALCSLCLMAVTVMVVTVVGSNHAAFGADVLTIGSDAPALDIEHWIQDGNGKFKPVTKFAKNKVYVVEFWATWCPPCVASMPHLAQLQEEYADKNVQIISITNEDLKTVDKFLKREFQGDQDEEGDAPATYRELTSAYCLTSDPDGSSHSEYMEAAEQNGIPSAFIVGKDSKIEWIGHPMAIDAPLKAILSDSWDRAAFLKQMEAEKAAEKALEEIIALLRKQKFDDALKLIDKTLEVGPNMQLSILKVQVLTQTGKSKLANAALTKLFKDASEAGDGETADGIAWNIYQMAMQGGLPDKTLAETAAAEGEKVLANIKQKRVLASLYDSLAHLNQFLGDSEKAIALETKAVSNATGRMKEQMAEYLKELQGKEAGADK